MKDWYIAAIVNGNEVLSRKGSCQDRDKWTDFPGEAVGWDSPVIAENVAAGLRDRGFDAHRVSRSWVIRRFGDTSCSDSMAPYQFPRNTTCDRQTGGG